MAKQGRVIVVGSSNTDLVVHCEKLPGPGETVLGGELKTFAGGKGANQAVAAARAGAKVYFIGAFGDDAFGRARRADLEREGVDCSGCVIKKGVPSGVALIAVGRHGKGKAENQILVAPGANARLTPKNVIKGMPRNVGCWDCLLCSFEVPIPSVYAAIQHADQCCVFDKIVNPAPYPIERLPRGFFSNCVITPNETEYRLLTGLKPGAFFEKVFRKLNRVHTFREVIITLGAKGVLHHYIYRDGKGPLKGPVFVSKSGVRWSSHGPPGENKLGADYYSQKKVKVVDTVGAGDCFNGCLASRVVENNSDYEDAIRFAVAAASLKVTRHGAQAGMPYRAEILKMLKRMK